jgi:hypothetical protein
MITRFSISPSTLLEKGRINVVFDLWYSSSFGNPVQWVSLRQTGTNLGGLQFTRLLGWQALLDEYLSTGEVVFEDHFTFVDVLGDHPTLELKTFHLFDMAYGDRHTASLTVRNNLLVDYHVLQDIGSNSSFPLAFSPSDPSVASMFISYTGAAFVCSITKDGFTTSLIGDVADIDLLNPSMHVGVVYPDAQTRAFNPSAQGTRWTYSQLMSFTSTKMDLATVPHFLETLPNTNNWYFGLRNLVDGSLVDPVSEAWYFTAVGVKVPTL